MALTADDVTSTPLGYATPEQVASAQAFADLLSKSATNNQLIRSPWQGAQRITEAVMSGLNQGWAAKQSQQARDAAAQQRLNASNYGNAGVYANNGANVASGNNPGYVPAPPTPTPAGPVASPPPSNYWNPNYGSPSAATGVGATPWGILAPPPASNAYTGAS
jgi:hypothetical protein